MKSWSRRVFGFTLIELMVTVVVMVVLMLIAFPSFQAFQQRTAIRGASDEVLSVWNDARFEAAKRNENVKFGVYSDSTGFCVGAATTTNPADSTPCNCMEALPSSQQCNISRFPADQADWRGVTLDSGTNLGGTGGVVVLDLKQLRLTDATKAGAISLNDPPGSKNYRVNIRIDQFGRAIICGSSAVGLDRLAEHSYRQCAP